jgi:hypothetical protein
MTFHMQEKFEIEEKTRLSETQFIAFKAACSEVGLKRADVMRALIVQFIRQHHRNQSLHALGLADMPSVATERD